MGCDYDWPTYYCKKDDCNKVAKNQYPSANERYNDLCDEHWEEFLESSVSSLLADKPVEEALRMLTREVIMLGRQRCSHHY